MNKCLLLHLLLLLLRLLLLVQPRLVPVTGHRQAIEVHIQRIEAPLGIGLGRRRRHEVSSRLPWEAHHGREGLKREPAPAEVPGQREGEHEVVVEDEAGKEEDARRHRLAERGAAEHGHPDPRAAHRAHQRVHDRHHHHDGRDYLGHGHTDVGVDERGQQLLAGHHVGRGAHLIPSSLPQPPRPHAHHRGGPRAAQVALRIREVHVCLKAGGLQLHPQHVVVPLALGVVPPHAHQRAEHVRHLVGRRVQLAVVVAHVGGRQQRVLAGDHQPAAGVQHGDRGQLEGLHVVPHVAAEDHGQYREPEARRVEELQVGQAPVPAALHGGEHPVERAEQRERYDPAPAGAAHGLHQRVAEHQRLH
mmetsp:Transcript_38223/g.94812  ORF Transcript_38223/g.94812 Transcript_38223/m.94812 type:complete len:360 (+) Transcript_38223:189-1268(+)